MERNGHCLRRRWTTPALQFSLLAVSTWFSNVCISQPSNGENSCGFYILGLGANASDVTSQEWLQRHCHVAIGLAVSDLQTLRNRNAARSTRANRPSTISIWLCCKLWLGDEGRLRSAPWSGVAAMDKIKTEFAGRHFTADVILWAVRWYLQFPISYRDLERMLADRGVFVDHTTVSR